MSELNQWFLSLPEGRQKALLDGDRWMLAEAVWQARALAAPTAPAPTEPVAWGWLKEHAEGIAYTLLEDGDKEASDTIHSLIAAVTMAATPPSAVEAAQPEAVRPDILERLSYHARERDDLTLDDCLSYLAKGWRNVHGRTERQMVMQILELLAAAPTTEATSSLSDAERLDAAAGTACKALLRAWHLGQTYWSQADSESYSQNRRSEETHAKFVALVDETRAAIATKGGKL